MIKTFILAALLTFSVGAAALAGATPASAAIDGYMFFGDFGGR